MTPAERVALLVQEDVELTRRDAAAYPCDHCKAALGSDYFDTNWLCPGCREILWERLKWEPYREKEVK
jgi:hypothetical protein